MSKGIDLIVGLGNPGEKYRNTRHNVGFWCMDCVAAQANTVLREEAKFHGALGKASLRSRQIWLLKPSTFMNLSGDAVNAICKYYKIPIENCLVVHDELALLPGALRLKRGGGHGGHNGLRHIMQCLGSEFMRLRIGVGHPGAKHQVTSYLLNEAGKADIDILQEAVTEACACMGDIVSGQWDKATLRLHSRKVESKPE